MKTDKNIVVNTYLEFTIKMRDN